MRSVATAATTWTRRATTIWSGAKAMGSIVQPKGP